MSLLNFSDIPGYAEAVKEEQHNRDIAFLVSPPPICGVPIVHMSLRHWSMLIGCRNRFIHGERPEAGDVAMFLWFLSPDYAAGDNAAREKFVAERVRPLDFGAAVKEIFGYLARVFQDIPSSNGKAGDSKSYTAPVASMVDLLAHEYGWTDETILTLPLSRLFQYLRRIEKRNDPKAMQFNRSEQFVSRWLQERTAPTTVTCN